MEEDLLKKSCDQFLQVCEYQCCWGVICVFCLTQIRKDLFFAPPTLLFFRPFCLNSQPSHHHKSNILQKQKDFYFLNTILPNFKSNTAKHFDKRSRAQQHGKELKIVPKLLSEDPFGVLTIRNSRFSVLNTSQNGLIYSYNFEHPTFCRLNKCLQRLTNSRREFGYIRLLTPYYNIICENLCGFLVKK